MLFRQLADELASMPEVRTTVIDIARRGTGKLPARMHVLHMLKLLLRAVSKADVVSLHAPAEEAIMLGPLVWIACRLFRKCWIFRGFGADFDSWYQNASSIRRMLFRRTVLRADIALFETRASVLNFGKISRRQVRWYPNNRPFDDSVLPPMRRPGATVRFFHSGHAGTAEGVHTLMAAAEALQGEGEIDVYGPLQGRMGEAAFRSAKVDYKGLLPPGQTTAIMHDYDALVLPAYDGEEAYPGVILDAYCAGLPVIAVRQGAIPEIVDDSCGILVEPGNAMQLAQAMQALVDAPNRIDALRQGALVKAREFSSRFWSREFVRLNRELMAMV